MSGGRENKALTAEIEAAKDRTKRGQASMEARTKDDQLNEMVMEYNKRVRERDAAQAGFAHCNDNLDEAYVALGLASEEVRELRAEVARLTEALRESAQELHKRTRHEGWNGNGERFEDCTMNNCRAAGAALSPASTSVRITPSGEAVRLASTESEQETIFENRVRRFGPDAGGWAGHSL